MTKYPTVPAGAALSVAGPTEGMADVTTSTSEETLDLSAYKGKYVNIWCETVNHYVAFVPDTSTAMHLTAATTTTAGVPRLVVADTEGIHVVVPEQNTVLRYRAVSSTGTLRVSRS